MVIQPAIQPSRDYEGWCSFFIGSIQPDGQYSNFLPACCHLLTEISENGVLSPPLTDRSSHFLNEIFPLSLRGILNLPVIDLTADANTQLFFNVCISLLPIFFASHQSILFNLILEIFDPTTELARCSSLLPRLQPSLIDHSR
jgi:hypothetical protein